MNFLKPKKKGNYTIEDVDKKIENSNKKIIGDEINKLKKEISNKAIMWGSLSLYLSDKIFLKLKSSILEKFDKKKLIKFYLY